MTKTKKRPAKSGKKGSKSRASASAAEAGAETPSKNAKAFEVQGVRVMTPGGTKPGKRGATAYLKLAQIKVVKGFNPRTEVGDVTELERSIRKQGLLNSITVRPSGDGKTFQVVAGERRLTALKNLGAPWTDSIPVNIRVDLEGNDLEAKAVAIAENSEDGRTNLTYVEIGRQCVEFERKKWPIARIASETGLHPKKVRRALDLMRSSDDIIEKVEKGELKPITALEFNKMPETQRASVLERVGPGATVAEVRKARKEIEREERRAAVAQGEDKGKTKRGTARQRAPTAWKPAREKQDTLRALCYDFVNAEEKESDGWHELRGAIGAMLWDRGDIESPLLPSIHTSSEKDPAAAKKANKVFEGIVTNEASLHKPEDSDDGADDGDDEGADAGSDE